MISGRSKCHFLSLVFILKLVNEEGKFVKIIIYNERVEEKLLLEPTFCIFWAGKSYFYQGKIGRILKRDVCGNQE